MKGIDNDRERHWELEIETSRVRDKHEIVIENGEREVDRYIDKKIDR